MGNHSIDLLTTDILREIFSFPRVLPYGHPVRAVSTSGGRVCQLCDRAPILDHECVEPAEVWVCCRATRCQLTRIPWNLDAIKWIGENMRRKDMLVCDDCDQYLHKSECLGFPPQVSSP